MKEQDKKILIKNCILKSGEALSDAEYNLKDKRYSSALNRIYYAVFYSVMALAYKEGFTTSKHSQWISWFNKKYIYEEKIFDPLLKDIYKHAYKQR
ncbi:MAG: HEPN domain-containing protein [Ignavibacteriaceae bacterium]